MKPFFTFYGGKWRAAPRYASPVFDTIIEPFAGAAGYAVRYSSRNVILVEKDPVIAALWRYLIGVSAVDIRNLPLIAHDQSVDDLGICEEARFLIGFWLNKGCNGPRKTPGQWMRLKDHNARPKSFWGVEIRERVASQVEGIKHWTVIEGDYSVAPDMTATWFIDPPYKEAGKIYRCSSRDIDYHGLAAWCKSRQGQVMVCENEGAEWLPFAPFAEIMSTKGKRGKSKSKEAIWIKADEIAQAAE